MLIVRTNLLIYHIDRYCKIDILFKTLSIHMSIPLVAVHCLLLQERGLMTTSKCVTHIQNTNSIQIQTSLNVFTVNICNVLRHIASLDNNSLYIGYSTHSVFSDVIGYTDIYFKFCRVADGGLFCSMLSYYDASPLCFHSFNSLLRF